VRLVDRRPFFARVYVPLAVTATLIAVLFDLRLR